MHFSFPQPLWPLLLVAVLLLSAGSRLAAQAPAWQDATGPGAGGGSSTAVDAAGNTYVTGSFRGTASFGAITLTSAGNEDVFVAKRTPAGIWQWATRAGDSNLDAGSGVVVDGSGSVVVIGTFTGLTITLGATTLTNASPGTADVFVAKLTPTGAWLWATRMGGRSDDYGDDLAVDGSGSVVVTGGFKSSTISFGPTTLTNAGNSDLFVAKLTPMGAWLWAIQAGGSRDEVGYGVAVDGNGSVVVTGGFFSPNLNFGATTLTNAGDADIFVAKLTPTGAWQWATGAGGNGDDRGLGVVDGSGSVVVTGFFASPTVTFGATTLTSAGSADIFVAKLTPTGAWQWATGAGGSIDEMGYGIAVDGSGSVLVTGSFSSPTSTFGTTTLTNATSAVNTDLFVARLTPTGAWQWATGAGGNGFDDGSSVAVDGSGSVVATGFFQSPTITFGATTLTNPSPSPGSGAIFLARLSGTTGLPEAADHPQLTLTPNPARTTVQITGAPGATATLLDALGRPVGIAPISPAGAATLDVRALPAGLYLLRAGPATRRLMVE